MTQLDDAILVRLREALDADPRADRRICEDANIGPNYIRGVFKEGKEPSLDYLMKILGELGPEATMFVLTGMRIGNDDLEFIRMIQSLPTETKSLARQLLSKLQDGE